jgi:hypothetical protein
MDVESDLFEMGLAFAKSVKAGEVKVKEEMGTEESSRGSSRDVDDTVPF